MSNPRRSLAGRAALALTATAAAVLTPFVSSSATAAASTAPPPRDRSMQNALRQGGTNDTHSVVLTLKGGVNPTSIAAVRKEIGAFKIERMLPVTGSIVADLTESQVKALTNKSGVAKVERNDVVKALDLGADTATGMAAVRNQLPTLDGNTDGKPLVYSAGDMNVAVLDTGVDPKHVALDGGKVVGWVDVSSFEPAKISRTPVDPQGHGTHVAGIVAGTGEGSPGGIGRGVAPGAGIVGVRVLDEHGGGTEAGIAAGLQWVIENRKRLNIRAVNMSIGSFAPGECQKGDDFVARTADAVARHGIVVVVAAGNEGNFPCSVGSPGAAKDVITVGASTDSAGKTFGPSEYGLPRNGMSVAPFSSTGPTGDGRIKPEVLAPGVAIYSAQANTGNGYVAYDGTSMAAPYVAGLVVVMLEGNPKLTPAQVKKLIMDTAIDRGAKGVDIHNGAGFLNSYNALRASGQSRLLKPPALPTQQMLTGRLAKEGDSAVYSIKVASDAFPLSVGLTVPGRSSYARGAKFGLELYNPKGELEQVYVNEIMGPDADKGLKGDVHARGAIGVMSPYPGEWLAKVTALDVGGQFIVDTSSSGPKSLRPCAPTSCVALELK